MNELITDAGITVTPYGCTITRILTLDEWKQAMGDVRQIKHAYHAVLSDLTAYGRDSFGDETVADALEQLEFEWADATKAAAIATIPLATRTQYELNSEHAFTLSRIRDKDEQLKWADITQREKLTPLELKRSIHIGRVIRAAEITESSGQSSGFPTVQAVRFHFERWERQMGDRKSILRLNPPDRKQILKVLEPIIALAADLEESL